MATTVDDAPDPKRRAARAFSKALFGGARYRIEVGAAIETTEPVNTARLAEQLNIARQSVNQELRVLVDAGLLTRTSRQGREVYYVPEQSAYWSWCREAMAQAAGMLGRKEQF